MLNKIRAYNYVDERLPEDTMTLTIVKIIILLESKKTLVPV